MKCTHPVWAVAKIFFFCFILVFCFCFCTPPPFTLVNFSHVCSGRYSTEHFREFIYSFPELSLGVVFFFYSSFCFSNFFYPYILATVASKRIQLYCFSSGGLLGFLEASWSMVHPEDSFQAVIQKKMYGLPHLFSFLRGHCFSLFSSAWGLFLFVCFYSMCFVFVV